MKKIFVFLLLAALIPFSSGLNLALPSILVAAREEPKFTQQDEDSDDNKIFDELDSELKAKRDSDKVDIVALFNLPPGEVDKEVEELKRSLGDFETKDTYEIIPGFAATLTKKQVVELSKRGETLQIEPDAKVQAHLNTATNWFGIQKARADFSVDGNADGNPAVYTKDDIVVAVIDTGIDIKHQDLDGGKVIGWKDFVNNKATPYDDNRHGTHVAGIAAGEGQANPSFTGVAPRAALVGVKVLNSGGSGTVSGVVSGIDWVVANKATFGIEVINLSLGTSGCSSGTDSLSQAVNNAVSLGIAVAVSAGNSGPGTCTIGSPAAAAGAITVGAMADVGEKGFYLAAFSSRGPTLDGRTKPEVLAAGVAITAPRRGTTTGYIALSGTSMASPFVAGTAALILDKNPTLTPDQVKAKITTNSVDWVNTGSDIDSGSGRLDGYEAVRNASSPASPGTNITIPTHNVIAGNLSGTGLVDNWTIDVSNAAYPVALTLIMPTWTSTSSPDFDLRLFDPAGNLITSSLGVTRQETIAVTINSTGVYRIQVDSFAGNGPYLLDVSSGGAPPAPDTTSPTVFITSPTNGAQVSGTITITATASDNVGVAGVDFFVDATLIGTDTTAPYSVSWNTTTVANGPHNLTATARDAAGNTNSSTIGVSINNDTQPPTAPTNLTATAASSTQIDLSWNASTDNVGVTGYKVYRDNVLVATVPSTTYSDSGLSPQTTYSYQVSAVDAAGNESPKSSSALATTQPPPPSSLSINVSSPSTIAQGDTFDVRATISNAGSTTVTEVAATINLPAGLSTSDPQTLVIGNIPAGNSNTVTWEVRAHADGAYTIVVNASDSTGTTTQASTSITVAASSGD